MKQGYVQVYTGNGKGKTTASLGIIMRAVTEGMNVYLGQFIKDMEYNVIRCLRERFPEVTVEQYGTGRGCLLRGEVGAEDNSAAMSGYEKVKEVLVSEKYDVVILDEINVAAFFKLITTEQILSLIRSRPQGTELILTGRYAPAEIRDAADLVTEMQEEKHYYAQGVIARRGIEL